MRLAAAMVPALIMQTSALMIPLAPRGGAVRLGAPRLAGPPDEDTSSGIQVSLRDPETDRLLRRVKSAAADISAAASRHAAQLLTWAALWAREVSPPRLPAHARACPPSPSATALTLSVQDDGVSHPADHLRRGCDVRLDDTGRHASGHRLAGGQLGFGLGLG